MSNCLNIGYIFKTSLGSINGSFTEGNVATTKKITCLDGRVMPYISGQSLKYALRAKLRELGCSLSPLFSAENSKGVDITAGAPHFIDDDLFGYMIASKRENRRRTAPVRVSAAIALSVFKGDRDLGTKYKEGVEGKSMEAGGNLFETEMYYNFFRTDILIELDRIGRFKGYELEKKEKGEKPEPIELPLQERKKRVVALLESIRTLWGGGKQSRFMTDLSPKFIIYTRQSKKSPIFLESFCMDKNEALYIHPVLEVLKDSPFIDNTVVGLRSGIFLNEEEIKSKLSDAGYRIMTVNEAIDAMIIDVQSDTVTF
ncbi:MAG: type I-B CRISPR-associated protein Cas7/Cst2/DevR [wastewater metagenome]|nr:type I-B CRISPR-associated protein Cas7/Cst2/DevR [Candidatus Loosdrechtia aerotolerans]